MLDRLSESCLRRGGIVALSTAVLLLLAPQAHAGLVNDVPSCYAVNKIAAPSGTYDKLVYLLIDQTVLLDPTLQQSVLNNMLSLLQPGTKFVVAEFSAFSQEHYLNVLHTGIIETPIPASQEGDVVMSRLGDFKTCLKNQAPFAQRMALSTAAQVMKASSDDLAQSDVMLALKTVSDAVRQDKAAKKVVFVVTDGLENSSVTSFYAHDAVRDVNADAEMKKAEASQLVGDFGGARVYVLGGGVMVPATKGSAAERNGYRDPKTLLDLKRFWGEYFSKSNGMLVEFGEPALVEGVGW